MARLLSTLAGRTQFKDHRIAMQDNGEILVAWGLRQEQGTYLFPSRQLFRVSPATRMRTKIGDNILTTGRAGCSLTRLSDGTFLIAGGGATGRATATEDLIDTATAEIYDPKTETTRQVGSMHQARRGHAAVLLPTGKVLIIGGKQHLGELKYTYPNYLEVFDPETGQFSVMDKMDCGLTEPQGVLMKDGGVFLAGQIQAPMEAPAQPKAMRWDAELKSFKLVEPNNSDADGKALTVGSSLTGFIAGNDIKIDYITMNQGVQKYLNAFKRADDSGAFPSDENTRTGNPEISPLLKDWKKNVPSIANRPAKLELIFRSSHNYNSDQTACLVAKIEILPPQGSPYSAPVPRNVNVVPWLRMPHVETNFMAIFTLRSDETIPGAKIRITLDPDRIVNPKTIPLNKLQFDVDPNWKVMPPLKFKVIPVRYVDKGAKSAKIPQGIDLPAPIVDSSRISSIRNMLMSIYPIADIEYVGTLPEPELLYEVGSSALNPVEPIRLALDTPLLKGWDSILADTEFLRVTQVGKSEHIYTSLLPEDVPQPEGLNMTMGVAWPGFPHASDIIGNSIANLSSAFLCTQVSNPTYSTMPHEIAHNYGRGHAPTPGSPGVPTPGSVDPQYPYPDGRMGNGWVSIFDVVGMMDYRTPEENSRMYDLMGYIKPRWCSDYTFGGIAMTMRYYHQLMHGAALISQTAGGYVNHQKAQSIDLVLKELNVSVVELFFYSDGDVKLKSFYGDKVIKLPVEELSGEYLFIAEGMAGERYQFKFNPREWRENLKHARIIVPNPEKWSKICVTKNGELQFIKKFNANPNIAKKVNNLILRMSVFGNAESADASSITSKIILDWGDSIPESASARVIVNSRGNLVPNFAPGHPIVEIPKRLLDIDSNPIIEIHAYYGLVEKVWTVQWGSIK